MKRIILFIIAAVITLSASAKLKYIFYFIGDGMGPNQVLAAEMYRAELEGRIGRVPTLMSQFTVSGELSTFSASNGITDSSAAGTVLATGTKTNNGTLGLSANGDTLSTIAEYLHNQGWGVGIMTSVAIDHATPGAFYGNDIKRSHYYAIGKQLTQTEFDFFGGAGFHHPQGKKDDKAHNLYDLAEQAGYTIVRSYDEAQRHLNDRRLIMIQPSDSAKVHSDNIGYAIDHIAGNSTLKQIVQTSIPFLMNKYDRFFMMVEGGMIDYACHSNDGRTAIEEVWAMDEALQEAYNFYLQHPNETLILVTADHETGGMALGNSDYTLNLQVLQHQQCSQSVLTERFQQLYQDSTLTPSWEQVSQVWKDNLGFWNAVSINADEESQLREAYNTQDAKKMAAIGVEILNRQAKLGWTSHAHTAHAVPLFAIGVGAELFGGWHDNSEVVPLIRQCLAKPKKCRR